MCIWNRIAYFSAKKMWKTTCFLHLPFSLFTAYQILNGERHLTIFWNYAILFLKEWTRTWYAHFGFLIDFYTGRRVDHNFDHLQDWTIWKQCAQEHLKASFADAKALEIIKKDIKNRPGALRDQEVVGSSPVASTIKVKHICLNDKCANFLNFWGFLSPFLIILINFWYPEIKNGVIRLSKFLKTPFDFFNN